MSDTRRSAAVASYTQLLFERGIAIMDREEPGTATVWITGGSGRHFAPKYLGRLIGDILMDAEVESGTGSRYGGTTFYVRGFVERVYPSTTDRQLDCVVRALEELGLDIDTAEIAL